MECTVTVSKVENKVIAEIYAGAKFRNGTRFHRFLFVIQDAQGNPLWDNFSNPGTITIGAPRDGSFRSEREHRSWDIPAAVRERAAKVEFIFQFKDNGGFPNLPPNLAEDVLKKAVEMLVQG